MARWDPNRRSIRLLLLLSVAYRIVLLFGLRDKYRREYATDDYAT